MNDYYEIETVTDLKEHVDSFHKEIYCNGKTTASHSYPSSVSFYNKTTKKYMKLSNIYPDTHGGCGCWVGMNIEFEEVSDD